MQVIPAIFEKEFNLVVSKLDKLTNLSPRVQIDVSDGVFTSGKSFELELLSGYSPVNTVPFLFDIHLMVNQPQKWLNKCLVANASRVIAQVEMMASVTDFVSTAISSGLDCGLSYDIATPLPSSFPPEIDVLMLMGRQAGFKERNLEKQILLSKIAAAQKIRQKGLSFKIAVDGGVRLSDLAWLRQSGVDIVFATSLIWTGSSPKANLQNIQDEINSSN